MHKMNTCTCLAINDTAYPMVHMCRVMFGRWKVKLAHHDEASIEISMEAAYVSPVIDLVSAFRSWNELDEVVMSEYDG